MVEEGKTSRVWHMHTLQTDLLGPVRIFPFSSSDYGHGDAIAIVSGSPEETPEESTPPLLRVHSSCLYGDVLRARDCDCFPQFRESARLILDEGSGIICYLDQEGRGQGLMRKAFAYEYMEKHGTDSVEAYTHLNYELDPRRYSHVAAFLREMHIPHVRLLTNNPQKIQSLESHGIRVERVPLITGVTRWNSTYLATKRNKLGHLIDTLQLGT